MSASRGRVEPAPRPPRNDSYTLIADPYNPCKPHTFSSKPLKYTLLFWPLQGVMVRLMLVLAPVMCIVSGVAASSLLSLHVKDIEPKVEKHDIKKKRHENNLVFRSEVRTNTNIHIVWDENITLTTFHNDVRPIHFAVFSIHLLGKILSCHLAQRTRLKVDENSMNIDIYYLCRLDQTKIVSFTK